MRNECDERLLLRNAAMLNDKVGDKFDCSFFIKYDYIESTHQLR